jgi:hypothetical protein
MRRPAGWWSFGFVLVVVGCAATTPDLVTTVSVSTSATSTAPPSSAITTSTEASTTSLPTTTSTEAPTTTTVPPTTTEAPTTIAPATVPPTLPPTTTAAPPPPVASGAQPAPEPVCDPNYSGACVPIASDVDCAGGKGNGPAYVEGPVYVIGVDIYRLDADHDGIGCEGG